VIDAISNNCTCVILKARTRENGGTELARRHIKDLPRGGRPEPSPLVFV
jgi:hypothetical protein